MHQWPLVFFVGPSQHGRQCGLIGVERNIGNETQSALVDADQWRSKTGQAATNPQHRPIAPDDKAQIAPRTDLVYIQRWIVCQSGIAGGFCFQRNLTSLALQEMCNVFQSPARAVTGGACS